MVVVVEGIEESFSVGSLEILDRCAREAQKLRRSVPRRFLLSEVRSSESQEAEQKWVSSNVFA